MWSTSEWWDTLISSDSLWGHTHSLKRGVAYLVGRWDTPLHYKGCKLLTAIFVGGTRPLIAKGVWLTSEAISKGGEVTWLSFGGTRLQSKNIRKFPYYRGEIIAQVRPWYRGFLRINTGQIGTIETSL